MNEPGKRSRYRGAERLEYTDPWGRTIPYHDVRFVPDTKPERFHVLREGERLDHVAFQHLRDPEAFWRLCDASKTPWPADLESRPGTPVAVPRRNQP